MSADGYGAMGAAIGTTLTGALVSIGGTIYAKRTALAYVLFNAVAGLLAILLLPAFLWMIAWLGTHLGLDPGATSLAAFHTLFIAVGVVLFRRTSKGLELSLIGSKTEIPISSAIATK